MNDLPPGWMLIELSELVDGPEAIVSGPFGSNLLASEYVDAGRPIVRLQNVARDEFRRRNLQYVTEEKASVLSAHRFRSGDILLTKLGDPLGKACIVPDDLGNGIVSADIVRIRVKQPLHARYVMLALNSETVATQLQRHTKGTTRPRVNLNHVRSLRVPIAPLAEQRRIVERLDTLLTTLTAAEAELRGAQRKLDAYRAAVLTAAFKAEWPTRPSSDVVERGTVISYGIVLPGPNLRDGVPYIRGQDITDDGQVLADQLWRTTPEIASKHARSAIWEGDVLLSVIRHLRVAIVPAGLDGANLTQGTVRLRPGPEINARFLAHYLRSPRAQSWMKSFYIGMSMPRINVEHARQIPIPVPPLEQQIQTADEIEAKLETAARLAGSISASIRRAKRLRQAIIKFAFQGCLADQDPNDEPASALLAHLMQEADRPRPDATGKKGGNRGRRDARATGH